MEVLTLLIPLALIMGIAFLIIFIWATVNGQFDDLETPPQRILFEHMDKKGKDK